MKQNKKQLINQTREDFIMIICQDPFLPFDLLPESWQGEAARTLVQSSKVYLIRTRDRVF